MRVTWFIALQKARARCRFPPVATADESTIRVTINPRFLCHAVGKKSVHAHFRLDRERPCATWGLFVI
jgi:hypothetical protein